MTAVPFYPAPAVWEILDAGSRVVVFGRLTSASEPIARLIARLGVTVIYISPLGSLHSPVEVARLARAGVHQVDYSRLTGFDVYSRQYVMARYAGNALDSLFPGNVLERVAERFPPTSDRTCKVRTLLYDALIELVSPDAPAYALAEYFRDRGFRCALWSAGDPLAALLVGRSGRVPVVIPSVLRATVSFGRYLCRAVLNRLFKQRASPTQAFQVGADVAGVPKASPPLDAQVLYFPHKGLLFGKLFEKDQYYAANHDSPLSRHRICHVELRENLQTAESVEIIQSYASKGVTPHVLDVPWVVGGYRRWLPAFMFGRRIGLKPLASLLAETTLRKVEQGMASLQVLPRAQLALVGYDYLFPLWLAYALQARGVRVVATQERLVQSFYPDFRLILDDYFVHGRATCEALSRNRFVIGAMNVVGDVRTDWVRRSVERHHGFPRGYDHATLVLDWHSDPNTVDNAQSTASNYANNRLFYLDVLKLARQFPRCCFVIRGKDAMWQDIPEFADIRREITLLPNVVVNADYNRSLISYELAAAADSVIARSTSLADQCMAAGKPVIYHDGAANGGLIVRSVLSFQPYLEMVTSYDGLASLYARVVATGDTMTRQERSALVERFFSHSASQGESKACIAARLESFVR